VLFAGLGAVDPTALFESDRMRDLLEYLVATYDLVIIDTPPVSVASDAVPLLRRAGGVIVVGRLAKSRQNAVTELGKQLTRLQAETVGVVVNGGDVPRDTYRYYYARPRG
jgi:Mrp family chromosome partitioning ATPase